MINKKITVPILIIVIISSIIWFFNNNKKPKLDFEKTEDGWYLFSNDFYSFNYPHQLTFKDVFVGIPYFPIFTDSQNDIRIMPFGGGLGMESLETLIYKKKPFRLPGHIIDSIRIKYPNRKKEYFDSITQNKVDFKIIDYIILDSTNHEYAHKIKFENDTFINAIELDSFSLDSFDFNFALNHVFEKDRIDNFYRRIYYHKSSPSKSATCYIREIKNAGNHAFLCIEEKIPNTDKALSKQDILKILKSFRLK